LWGHRNIWISLRTLPIRGWIVQQVCKIGIAHLIPEDVLLFLDSDIFFIKPISLNDIFIKDNKVRLFRQAKSNNISSQIKWHRSASTLLSLPLQDYHGARYIGHPVSWKRDNVLKLCQYIEKETKTNWVLALCKTIHFSEYILYGVFVDKVLHSSSDHYYDETRICHEYWQPSLMNLVELKDFISKTSESHVAVMITAKSGIPIKSIRKVLSMESA